MSRLIQPLLLPRCVAALIVWLSASLSPQELAAQAGYDGPKGRVEVMGLNRWTIPMLRDSIRHYVPGQDLHDAACMATLREKLGFADALVMHYVNSPQSEFLLIKVVEPQDRARVQWRPVPADSFQSLRADYARLILSDARALLVRLNGGRDLGAARADWETWVRTL